MIKVSKTRLAGRPGFVALWRDEAGKKFCRGISTTEELRADEIIAAMQRILNTPALLDPDHPDHATTTIAEAYRAIFGKPPPEPDDTVVISEAVPQSSYDVSHVRVGCDFIQNQVSGRVQVPSAMLGKR